MTLRAAIIRAGLLAGRYALLERRKERARDLLERELPAARRLYQQMRRSLGMAAQKATQAASDDDLPRPLAWLIRELKRRLGDLFDDLTGERLTPLEWRNAVKRVLSEFHLTSMMAGLNTEAIPGKAWGGLVDQINVQLEFLNNFRVEIQDDAAFKPGWEARARSYAESIKVPYWRGRTKVLPLPAMPGEGSQCLCITTPHSRVLTRRGWVAIADVVVGDEVMTHLMRWRPVLATPRNQPLPRHRQAWIRSASGAWVGCTDDHKFLTLAGWESAKSIDRNCLEVYTIPNEQENLHPMRSVFEQSQYQWFMYPLPLEVSDLWRSEGPSGDGMCFVRDAKQGAEAVAKASHSQANDSGHPGRRRTTAHSVFRPELGIKVANALRRPEVHLVLQRPGSACDYLSLSMGVDHGEWSYSERIAGASPEWELRRRPLGEFNVDGKDRAQQSSFGAGATEGDGRKGGAQIPNGGRSADLSELSETISAPILQAVEILLPGVLPGGDTLYDLTVADDHSFIVEGLVAHNSGCRCKWDVKPVDAANGDYDCYWVLERGAEHCQTCLERSQQWAPLRIREGVLQ